MDLLEKLNKAQAATATAKGRLSAIMERLETEHGCKTIAAAKKKLAAYTKRRDAAQTKYEKALEEFEETHAKSLELLDEIDKSSEGPTGRTKRPVKRR